MNFGERLTYWYLRLNGFFLLPDFVLHGTVNSGADVDVLAVRLPHVTEAIGGQPGDWDPRFEEWGIDLSRDMVGMVVEVKTGRYRPNSLARSGSRDRLSVSLQRLGLFPADMIDNVVEQLIRACSHRVDFVVVSKLLVGDIRPADVPLWRSITLAQVDTFICERVRRYRRKGSDRMFFPDELMQYLAWRESRAPEEI